MKLTTMELNEILFNERRHERSRVERLINLYIRRVQDNPLPEFVPPGIKEWLVLAFSQLLEDMK